MLPVVEPSKLTSLPDPMGHPNWLHELKYDGFRGLLYHNRNDNWLVSRKGYRFKRFQPLCDELREALKGHRAILDGEIVCLDGDGRSIFSDLMWRRGEPRYAAFDLMWLDGRGLRSKPLIERKRLLRKLIPESHSHLLYVDHIDDYKGFFETVCERDLEGIICKPRMSPYPFTWIKVKNPAYAQAIGRQEMFDRFRGADRIL
jgi:bifunctional non-homologous end joining protein LigD